MRFHRLQTVLRICLAGMFAAAMIGACSPRTDVVESAPTAAPPVAEAAPAPDSAPAAPPGSLIPLFNATCPGGIKVHADAGGPISINGKEGVLKKLNDTTFEATGSGVTISLSIGADGSPAVSYTGSGGTNGPCRLT